MARRNETPRCFGGATVRKEAQARKSGGAHDLDLEYGGQLFEEANTICRSLQQPESHNQKARRILFV